MRNADGMEVLHGAYDDAIVEDLVADDRDLSDLDLRPLINLESNLEGRGRNAAYVGYDRSVLVPALGLVFLDNVTRAVDLVLVVLLLDGEADLALLEPVENFGDGNRFVALVLDGPDDGALG